MKKLDHKAIKYIRQWLEDLVFHYVSTKESAHSLWRTLKILYERNTAMSKAFLIQKLINLKYKKGSSIAEYLNVVKNIIISSMKVSLDDELQALLLLSFLSDS